MLLAAPASGGIVWSFHNSDGPTFIASLIIGGFLGFLAGGLVGVHLFPSLGTMAAFGGLFEGVFQGWTNFGWGGAIAGGLIGIVAGSIIAGLPVMLIHFVMIICGIDPFVNPDSSEETKSESS